MGDKKQPQKPVHLLNLEREISQKLFISPRANLNRSERDPITQVGISLKETELPSQAKPRGLARGAFSSKGNGSFKFDCEARAEGKMQPGKRAECVPVSRNPITQEDTALPAKVGVKSKEEYSKVRDSTVFSQSQATLVKPRANQYYDTMKSSIFTQESKPDAQYKSQLRQVQYNPGKQDQMYSVLSYNDGSRPEAITAKPTNQRIRGSDVGQVHDLYSHAKSYNERRNQSAISFNYS